MTFQREPHRARLLPELEVLLGDEGGAMMLPKPRPTLLDEIIATSDAHDLETSFEQRISNTRGVDQEMTLSASVGQGGANSSRDVAAVQGLLNTFILTGQLSADHFLIPDGVASPKTITAIREFQRRVVGLTKPDGRVDPGGRTLSELNRRGPTSVPYFRGIQEPVWPVQTNHPNRYVVTRQDIKGSSRNRGFGAARPNGRRHQGVDLYGYHKDVVRAIAKGRVVDDPRHFYLGTDRVLIEGDGGVILYGEVERGSAQSMGIVKGKEVKAGDPIARIGCMRSQGGRCTSHMLHLETYVRGITRRPGKLWYAGKTPPAELLDPTDLLRRAAARAQTSSGTSQELSRHRRRTVLLPEIELLLDDQRDTMSSRSRPQSLYKDVAEEEEEEEFRISTLSQPVREAFSWGSLAWTTAVNRAIESGITDINVLTNLVFFMHHPERIQDGSGRPIDPSEPEFAKLSQEWKSWRTLIRPILDQAPKRSAPGTSAPAMVAGQKRLADIREVAATAGLAKIYQDFLTLCAYGESRGNNLVGLGIPERFPPWTKTHRDWVAKGRPPASNAQTSEAAAAARGYRNNPWLHRCWPGSAYAFGSGGWFGLLPSSGLAVFRNTSLACQHPWSVFDGPASVVMAMGFIRRLRGWSQFKANPTVLALRVGWGAPSKMNDAQWLAKRRLRYSDHAEAVGLPATFLDQVLPSLPSFDPGAMMGRVGGAIWLPR